MTLTETSSPLAEPSTRPPWRRRQIYVVPAAACLGLVLLASRYGHHRDDLYILDAAQRLDWGYVDKPPLSVFLARLVTGAPGIDDLVALRSASALALAGVLVLAADLAAQLGASARGMVASQLVLLCSPVILGIGHLYSAAPFDLLLGLALTALAVRLAVTPERRLFVAAGLVTGVGIMTKHTFAAVALALAVGVVAVCDDRRVVIRSGLLLSGLVAVPIVAPNLAWQIAHGWPTVEEMTNLGERHRGLTDALVLVPLFVFVANPFLLAVWRPGWLWLRRHSSGAHPARVLLPAAGVLVVLASVVGLKPYHLAPVGIWFTAAGVTLVERAWPRPRQARVAALVGVSGAAGAVFALPLLPSAWLASTPIPQLNEDVGDTIGWPELVETVAAARDTLPPSSRDGATILTSNWGEAGAVNQLGEALDLPPAISGHGTYWLWGQGAAAGGPVIVVGIPPDELPGAFDSCRRVARLGNDAGIENQEHGAPVSVCAAPDGGWAAVWPELKHYDG